MTLIGMFVPSAQDGPSPRFTRRRGARDKRPRQAADGKPPADQLGPLTDELSADAPNRIGATTLRFPSPSPASPSPASPSPASPGPKLRPYD